MKTSVNKASMFMVFETPPRGYVRRPWNTTFVAHKITAIRCILKGDNQNISSSKAVMERIERESETRIADKRTVSIWQKHDPTLTDFVDCERCKSRHDYPDCNLNCKYFPCQ